MRNFVLIILLCFSASLAEWNEEGKSGIEAIDTLPTHEWDVETKNDNFWLGMGLGLFLPGGTQYYTEHYVRAGFLTGLEVYLLSEIFINYDIRLDKKRENARFHIEEATSIAQQMANDPFAKDYNNLNSQLKQSLSNVRENNDLIEENAGLLTSQKAWLAGLHLYGLMDGYGILKYNQGRSTQKKEVWNALWRSLVIPGWGQIYNDEYGKAGLLYMSMIGSYYSYHARQNTVEYYLNRLQVARAEGNYTAVSYTEEKVTFFRKKRNQYIWGGLLFYLYSLADAAVDAVLSDFDDSKQLAFKPRIEPNGLDGVQWVWSF